MAQPFRHEKLIVYLGHARGYPERAGRRFLCSNAPADLASVEREIYGFVRIFAIFLIFCSTDARSAGAYTHDFLQLPFPDRL